MSIILIMLLVASCKKDRECECLVTTTYPAGKVDVNGAHFSTSTKVVVYENATRRKAKTLCKDYIMHSSTGHIIEKECKVKF
jgi:hypothetical protein